MKENGKNPHSSAILQQLGKTNFNLQVVIFEKKIQIGDILSFNLGTVLKFPMQNMQEAYLSIHGKRFAYGEILKQKERYAFKVQKIAS